MQISYHFKLKMFPNLPNTVSNFGKPQPSQKNPNKFSMGDICKPTTNEPQQQANDQQPLAFNNDSQPNQHDTGHQATDTRQQIHSHDAGQHLDSRPDMTNAGRPTTCHAVANYHNDDRSVMQYDNQQNRPIIEAHINNNPHMDSALARNIDLRTNFAKFVGFLIFIVLLACIAVIAVDSKNEYESMVLDEQLKIESCLKSYEENKCHPHQRVPALNDYCLDLELCINSDPRKVAKRSAAFSTLVAENANRLFGTLKLQTIIVMCILLFGSIISCNLFLSREKASSMTLHRQKTA
jgi:Di-sulfide bridge nucleocytoplasmic transport domain